VLVALERAAHDYDESGASDTASRIRSAVTDLRRAWALFTPEDVALIRRLSLTPKLQIIGDKMEMLVGDVGPSDIGSGGTTPRRKYDGSFRPV
jgi:hypothetical protein